MPKRPIRAQFLAKRKMLACDVVAALSKTVQRRFLQSNVFHESDCLGLYSSIHNEVRTDEVASLILQTGKTLAYPRVSEKGLEFVKVSSLTDLAPGMFNVLEPLGACVVPVHDLDLVVVPGVVFDRGGHRLGYGQGFYDRTLAECRRNSLSVGFAYDFQLVDKLPVLEHDRTLNMIMTETETLNFTSR